MNKYFIGIEVKDGEIEKILGELHEAQEKMGDCYRRLRDLGVLTIRKDTADGSDDTPQD
ncbi:MAG: hypothetical protein IJ849_12230 [Selenomonadaceae bacterium]|nr:hypothetical protein [Selenomonadaceae bacterium]